MLPYEIEDKILTNKFHIKYLHRPKSRNRDLRHQVVMLTMFNFGLIDHAAAQLL